MGTVFVQAPTPLPDDMNEGKTDASHMTRRQAAPLNLYDLLNRTPLSMSYLGKIMLVAFVGTHIPLMTLFGYALLSTDMGGEATLHVMVVALLATLAGTAVTLVVLRALMRPIELAGNGLRQYLEQGTLPELPVHYTDEAGMLMADTMEALSQLDGAIHQLRHYDPLTALPNRDMFRRTLELELMRDHSDTEPRQVMVLALDLDRFADVNNSYGQSHGDVVLRQVAQRLIRCLESDDVLSRVGGDEFALLRLDCGSAEEAAQLAQKLLVAVHRPLKVDHDELYVSASIGIALGNSSEGVETNLLMADAGAALRRAKEQGGNTTCFYAQDMNETLRERLVMERDLRHAIDRGELQLVFQPQVDLARGCFAGAEVLLRWHHPTRGLVPPSTFIPLAESCGLIVPIGAWLLRETCAQGAAWQEAGLEGLRLAVNLSAAQFADPELVDFIAVTLEETGLDAQCLELELTETLVMDNAPRAVHVLEQLRRLGVTLALDDFGTGYSSLSYLKRFAMDLVKIDRSFIHGVSSDDTDAAMVRSIITMAHGLGLSVVAEGVEHPEQVLFLKRSGCDVLQGYHFSHPISAEDFFMLWSQQKASLDRCLTPEMMAPTTLHA
ncbi:MAG: EAL domain-containing protein [Myxococcota bacterium]